MNTATKPIKRILITGGTGLIGSRFINTYQDKYCFDVLTRQRLPSDRLFANTNNISLVHQLDDIDDLSVFDAVINLAGEPIANKRWSDKQKCLICQSRWDLTHQLSQRINDCQAPPSVFISGSAIGYYGRQGTSPIDESFEDCYNEFTHKVCNTWEQKALLSAEQTRVCILRTGIVLATNDGALKKMLLPYKLGLGGRFSTGKQYMSWIHIDDMVRAIDFLLTHQQCQGAFNLTAPTPVNNAEFSATLAQTLKRPNIAVMPGFALRTMFGEMADLFLFGQNVIPKKLEQVGFDFRYPTLKPALMSLLQ
ncbi:TIGR01777 family oxidoreductase [Thalassotalea ponticola]|uniref:TIGR01777 family oxidoreductase n=1 Tax=Thalassotalea ponticola TaxID=1523392 RepID=UPI0025B4DFE3|nr:TIGR01777 family oxidoreductase [Thalassotalea ponticola]MDN3651267.1 TIGR01777 family oxidoreductase [Thalassotalea ponticola]